MLGFYFELEYFRGDQKVRPSKCCYRRVWRQTKATVSFMLFMASVIACLNLFEVHSNLVVYFNPPESELRSFAFLFSDFDKFSSNQSYISFSIFLSVEVVSVRISTARFEWRFP